jgi:WD40 repeat protein
MMTIQLKQAFTGHAGPIYQLCEGRMPGNVLTASGDRFIAEWNLTTGQPSTFSVKMEDPCFAVHFIREENLLLVGTAAGNLHVIDLSAKHEKHNFKVHNKGVFHIAKLPNDPLVVVAGGDGFLSVWNIHTWKLVRHFTLGDDKLRHLNVCNERLYVVTSGGETIVFDLPWLNEIIRFKSHEGGTYCSSIHPLKNVLTTGGKDGYIRFWDSTNQFKEVHAIPAHNFGIYRICYSPNGHLAASASRDKTIKFWRTSDFEVVGRIERPELPGHTHSVNDLLWLDDNNLLSTGDDRRILHWDIASSK